MYDCGDPSVREDRRGGRALSGPRDGDRGRRRQHRRQRLDLATAFGSPCRARVYRTLRTAATELRSALGARRARDLDLDYVAFIDSDLTNTPTDLLKIGELMRSGRDYVKGSRFVEGGDMSAVPASRRVISTLGNAVARALFRTRVRDVTKMASGPCGLTCSSPWPLREAGFAVIVEAFHWALRSGLEPAEFPTTLRAQDASSVRQHSLTVRALWRPTFLTRYVPCEGGCGGAPEHDVRRVVQRVCASRRSGHSSTLASFRSLSYSSQVPRRSPMSAAIRC